MKLFWFSHLFNSFLLKKHFRAPVSLNHVMDPEDIYPDFTWHSSEDNIRTDGIWYYDVLLYINILNEHLHNVKWALLVYQYLGLAPLQPRQLKSKKSLVRSNPPTRLKPQPLKNEHLSTTHHSTSPTSHWDAILSLYNAMSFCKLRALFQPQPRRSIHLFYTAKEKPARSTKHLKHYIPADFLTTKNQHDARLDL